MRIAIATMLLAAGACAGPDLAYDGDFDGDPLARTLTVTWSTHLTPGQWWQVCSGDFDGDGYDDLFVTEGASWGVAVGKVYAGAPSMPWSSLGTTWPGATQRFFCPGDIDADGYDDLLLFNSGSLTLHRGSSSGLSTSTTSTISGLFGIGELAAVDANRDGYLDVALVDYNRDAAMYLGGATGLSSSAISLGPTGPISGGGLTGNGLWVGDLDADGKEDLLLTGFWYTETASVDGAGYTSTERTGHNGLLYSPADATTPTWIWPAKFFWRVKYLGPSSEHRSDEVNESLTVQSTIKGIGPSGADRIKAIQGKRCLGTKWCSSPSTDWGYELWDLGTFVTRLPTANNAVPLNIDLDGDGVIEHVNEDDLADMMWHDPYPTGASGIVAGAPARLPARYRNDWTGPQETVGDFDGDGREEFIKVDGTPLLAFLEMTGPGPPVDADGDGYDSDKDCDDADATINPGASEGIGDAIDQDCNGLELCWVDSDLDGYRLDSSIYLSKDTDCDDPGEALTTVPGGDCDDTDATVNPGARERLFDGIDNNCDGRACSSVSSAPTWTWLALVPLFFARRRRR